MFGAVIWYIYYFELKIFRMFVLQYCQDYISVKFLEIWVF